MSHIGRIRHLRLSFKGPMQSAVDYDLKTNQLRSFPTEFIGRKLVKNVRFSCSIAYLLTQCYTDCGSHMLSAESLTSIIKLT